MSGQGFTSPVFHCQTPGSTRMVSHPNAINLKGFGEQQFIGATAAPYLVKHGLAASTLETSAWASNHATAEKVAAAILEWARDNGASVYCHWFQPLGAEGMRHGQSGMVQNSMFSFDRMNKPVWDFKAKNLLKGETDGSSYPAGGLRATHSAGGYLSLDPTSYIFLRGDTIFLPACLTSFHGQALDEKTPLLRATDALSREGVRLLGLLGYKTTGLKMMIGLEQEFFFVPRHQYNRRPDLQFTGRTITGRMPARGQELGDHYMAPLSFGTAALPCIQEIQNECFKMGIPLCTRHREVAPNQYEFAPRFGAVTTQIDQNLMIMQIMEEVSARYGLAALMHEKPFAGVNGSGKHNNWSIATDEGVNLLNYQDLTADSGNSLLFPVIMAAIVKAVNDHGDLMRMTIACPGNDFRLGACEAPPSIISTYLGESLTKFLEGFQNGEDVPYNPPSRDVDLGSLNLPHITMPAEDRNRTSPFPYGGHRFEFRSVGSSQNVSLVNTVLGTIVAGVFKEFADAIEGGRKPQEVAAAGLKSAWKVVFNGDGYDHDNQEMLTAKGLWRIDSCVDAICRYTDPKNVKLFSAMKVLEPKECEARQTVMLTKYVGVVEMEARCLVDMVNQHIIPAVKSGEVGPLDDLQQGVATLQSELTKLHAVCDLKQKAAMARKLRLETMIAVRASCDAAEAVVPAHLWTLASYKELLFLDSHIE